MRSGKDEGKNPFGFITDFFEQISNSISSFFDGIINFFDGIFIGGEESRGGKDKAVENSPKRGSPEHNLKPTPGDIDTSNFSNLGESEEPNILSKSILETVERLKKQQREEEVKVVSGSNRRGSMALKSTSNEFNQKFLYNHNLDTDAQYSVQRYIANILETEDSNEYKKFYEANEEEKFEIIKGFITNQVKEERDKTRLSNFFDANRQNLKGSITKSYENLKKELAEEIFTEFAKKNLTSNNETDCKKTLEFCILELEKKEKQIIGFIKEYQGESEKIYKKLLKINPQLSKSVVDNFQSEFEAERSQNISRASAGARRSSPPTTEAEFFYVTNASQLSDLGVAQNTQYK